MHRTVCTCAPYLDPGPQEARNPGTQEPTDLHTCSRRIGAGVGGGATELRLAGDRGRMRDEPVGAPGPG